MRILKTLISALCLTALTASSVSAQTDTVSATETKKRTSLFLKPSPIYKQLNVKASNSWNNRTGMSDRPVAGLFLPFGNFRVEANYGLLSCLEVGAYFGYYDRGYTILGFGSNDPIDFELYSMNYGAQINFHPLGLFLNRNRNRWDVWLGFKYGQLLDKNYSHYYYPEIRRWNPYTEYGFGAGFSFLPFKHERLGFFMEFSIGQWMLKAKRNRPGFDPMGRTDIRWGMNYKFLRK
ncbi:MAG: hypothetical protein LBU91_05295 [Bacteroidales bacterium]|jgi:hypothetical protein|nr:hypothetical protein [Bacteroidales bacterium]